MRIPGAGRAKTLLSNITYVRLAQEKETVYGIAQILPAQPSTRPTHHPQRLHPRLGVPGDGPKELPREEHRRDFAAGSRRVLERAEEGLGGAQRHGRPRVGEHRLELLGRREAGLQPLEVLGRQDLCFRVFRVSRTCRYKKSRYLLKTKINITIHNFEVAYFESMK